jgi:hypothetical protein
LRAAKEVGLAERASLVGERRDMDEQDKTVVALPSDPSERVIIKIVAEIRSGGAGRRGGEAACVEMGGKIGGRQSSVEASGPSGPDDRPGRKGPIGIFAHRGAVMGRSLDAKTLGALADAEVNHYMRLQLLVEARHELRSLPRGGQDFGMELGVDLRRLARERFGKPSRRVLSYAGEGTKTCNKDTRPRHASDLP